MAQGSAPVGIARRSAPPGVNQGRRITRGSAHPGFSRCCSGLSTHKCRLRAQHPRASLGAIPAGCAPLLGSAPAPRRRSLLSGAVLAFRLSQVFGLGYIALSGFPLPLLAVCNLLLSVSREKIPSQTCYPQSCFSALTLAWAEAVAPCSPRSHVPHRPQDPSLQSKTAEQYTRYS